MSSRCLSYVVDKETKRKRRCKLSIWCNHNKFCYVHFCASYKVSILIIQKIWRGFRIRKLVNRFITLPTELQNLISDYVREQHVIKQINNKITLLITNRFKISFSHLLSKKVFYYDLDLLSKLCKYNYYIEKYNTIITQDICVDYYTLLHMVLTNGIVDLSEENNDSIDYFLSEFYKIAIFIFSNYVDWVYYNKWDECRKLPRLLH